MEDNETFMVGGGEREDTRVIQETGHMCQKKNLVRDLHLTDPCWPAGL